MPMKSSTERSDNWPPDEKKPASARGLVVSMTVADDGGGATVHPAGCPACRVRYGCERLRCELPRPERELPRGIMVGQ